MARDNDNAKEGKDFVWVDMKDSKGNIVKDGFGNAVKTRKFGAKAEAPAATPKTKAKPAAKPAAKKSVSATASAAPKAGASKGAVANVNVARSGASRSTDNKVKPKSRTPVPGMAIVTAVKNAFTGNGATDAAKISASGNINLGRKPKPVGAKVPAGAPNRAFVVKKKN
jgi:hypothetical protein